MKILPRSLGHGQRARVWIHDSVSGQSTCILETAEVLLEAPNWTLDGRYLVVNGAGRLWQISVDRPALEPIELSGLPAVNNDHVLDPDGQHIFVSTYDDWQIYRAPLSGGQAALVTGSPEGAGLMHFLHGVSPDGKELAFVGIPLAEWSDDLAPKTAEIFSVSSAGTGYQQITIAGVPADGPEYSPDGNWLYFNTEAFTGHAQIARMRPDGSGVSRLTDSDTVDWFPHLSPDGRRAAYLSYPPGTQGHPADLDVAIKIVANGDWASPVTAAELRGGQGTINVNSWSPDNDRFAYIDYVID